MQESATDRPEPRGCTLADLIALTLGAAIASSLYWHGSSAFLAGLGGKQVPRSFVWFVYSLELIQKGCVALTPVILYRRRRSGEPLRPLDDLTILVAIGQITLTMWRWPAFGIVYSVPKLSSNLLVNMDAFFAWKLANAGVGLLAGLLAVLIRKARPGWIDGLCVALAWSGQTYAGGQAIQSWGNEWVRSRGWSTPDVRLFSEFVIQGPMGVVGNLPLAIALVDLGRDRGRRNSWVDWVETWVVLPQSLAFVARHLAGRWLEQGRLGSGEAVFLAGWIIKLGLAYALARWTEPAWRGLLEGSGVGTRPEVT